jgi:type IV pilus assembly protein PilE
MVHPKTLLSAPTRRAAGFTLIEVMIVVAIIALLATIAVPSYLDYVRKTRRADAITRISQVQQAQERWRANNATYASNLQLTASPPAGLGIAATNADGYYTLSITGSPTATSYTVLATATGAQLSDANCRVLSLTMSGGNTTLAATTSGSVTYSGTAANRCWNR